MGRSKIWSLALLLVLAGCGTSHKEKPKPDEPAQKAPVQAAPNIPAAPGQSQASLKLSGESIEALSDAEISGVLSQVEGIATASIFESDPGSKYILVKYNPFVISAPEISALMESHSQKSTTRVGNKEQQRKQEEKPSLFRKLLNKVGILERESQAESSKSNYSFPNIFEAFSALFSEAL